MSRSPASVGVTLRVVRFKSRTPRRVSSLRMASLSDDADTPRNSAACLKPRDRATARNA